MRSGKVVGFQLFFSDGIHHVVFHWVGWQVGLSSQPLGHISASFGGSTEESWAGFPPHLNGSWYYQHDRFIRRGVGRLGEDVAELLFLRLRNTHSPVSIFDVELAEEEGSLVRWLSGDHVDDPV